MRSFVLLSRAWAYMLRVQRTIRNGEEKTCFSRSAESLFFIVFCLMCVCARLRACVRACVCVCVCVVNLVSDHLAQLEGTVDVP